MKNQLREFAKNTRKKLNIKELSNEIIKNFKSLDEYSRAKNICCYYSFKDEIYTHDLFNDRTKNWYMPKIEKDNLLICPYCKNKLKENIYKIKEPDTDFVNREIIDLIIIPALAADKNGYRIGWGKGYYDRFLKTLKHNPIKIIFTYSDLFFDSIYPNSFDEKCDIIITEKEIYRIKC